MNPYYVLIIAALLSITGCNNDDDDPKWVNREQPESPSSAFYDLDRDGIDDFQVTYSAFSWDGVGQSGMGISGALKPLNENVILYQRDEKLIAFSLFNKPGDSIATHALVPLEWLDYPLTLVSIRSVSDSRSPSGFLWEKKWTIDHYGVPATDSYHLGLRIKKGEGFLVGWMKVQMDVTTGEIRVLEHDFTPEDHIIIKQ